MVDILDFLRTAGIGVDLNSYKVHLACISGKDHPLDAFLAGNFKEWQEFQRRKNFKCNMILSLIDLGEGDWLFAGVYRVLGCRWTEDHWTYDTELLPNQEELIGRIVVHHKRTARASYLWGTPSRKLPVVEIRRRRMTIEDFPGYNGIVIEYSKLKIITSQRIPSWHGALANVKGVYLITDTLSGKHYVGSAYGSEGMWQRWCSYAETGHGGNSDIKKILKKHGAEHRKFFQFSVLEIADTHASDRDIIARETYWKEVLRSREFGMNRN